MNNSIHESQPLVQADLHIRQAFPEEVNALAGLILAMAWESEERALEPDVLQAGIRAVFENPALGTYWVIQREHDLIACTLITTEWSDWNNAPYWWIQSLYIRPEYRGNGLFEQLLSHLEQAACVQNVPELRLYVEQNNQRAIRVYQRNGFESGHYDCMTKPVTRV